MPTARSLAGEHERHLRHPATPQPPVDRGAASPTMARSGGPMLARRSAALALLAAALALAPFAARAQDDPKAKEARFLKNVRQLTTGKAGEKAGEPYFS